MMRRSLLPLLLMLFACPALLAQPEPTAPKETVTAPPDSVSITAVDESGKPIAGATALVTYAGRIVSPRMPLPQLLRSSSRSGENGVIRFNGLEDKSQLQLAIAAPGYAAKPVSLISGLQNPARVVLHERTPGHHYDRAIIGRLVDAEGHPVANALLLVTRVQLTERSWSMGAITDDAMAATDDQGRFILVADVKALDTWIEVIHPSVCPFEFQSLHPSDAEQTLIVPEGVTITGRVVREGRPAAHIDLALGANDRTQQLARTTTGDDGRFTFTNLAPKRNFLIYPPMTDAQNFVSEHEVAPAAARQTVDVGDIDLLPSVALEGSVKADGQTAPVPSTVILQAFRTPEFTKVTTKPDGSFAFHNIPRGPYCVFVVCGDPKWHLSSKNRSFPYDNAQCLVGDLPRDKANLTILLDQSEAIVVQHRAEDEPMHGIEASDQKPR